MDLQRAAVIARRTVFGVMTRPGFYHCTRFTYKRRLDLHGKVSKTATGTLKASARENLQSPTMSIVPAPANASDGVVFFLAEYRTHTE